MSKVAFIGLGVMGYPMAGHLVAHGHKVCVYNRTAARLKHGNMNMEDRLLPHLLKLPLKLILYLFV